MGNKIIKEEDDLETQIYEVGYLFAPTLTQEEISKKKELLHKMIESTEGKILMEGEPVLRDLAYDMTVTIANKKEIYGNGYFGWIKFEGNSSAIKIIQNNLKENIEIIRFLVTKTIADNTLLKIEKLLSLEKEEVVKLAIQEKEKVIELKKNSKSNQTPTPVQTTPISKEEIDKKIDQLIVE
ncbi:30S ribosomal protein S6 [Patescibacteria group bacterium]|nr:30S ribosomal protein S6 [Patescibacteria group bacterium]MBU1730174.1 30S ribosomal protein S6 [Patescibacteria group bacterium]MBU1956643.1 30S ribosomal protein S6 [Patescibacteria group bacterium]MBU2010441.1 30S ribosomal protein S6 [Patescibacteria group bacterium]MBU2416650.1 30S ribosomal protein S6 [Patescibacteria group bacterium]